MSIETFLDLIVSVSTGTFDLFLDASLYILFGIAVAGVLRMFLSTDYIVRNLGKGRVLPVLKAALLGIPLPLCSCGVLPAAASLRKQGAGKGATAAFLISTPESGIDSIAVSWALLDPLMTVARPVVAFVTAFTTGIMENFFGGPEERPNGGIDRGCLVDGCCDNADCDPAGHVRQHPFHEKLTGGLKYAFGELWGDLAGWFAVGLILAGFVTALVPKGIVASAFGGGIGAMLLMLLLGIPLYICATASTPVAAALILKGVSPGAALVFLLVGPATNIASLSVLVGLLGKRAVAVYLGSIAVVSVTAGLVLDRIYAAFGISAGAVAGQASRLIPLPVQFASAALLFAVSIKPLYRSVLGWKRKIRQLGTQKAAPGCGCGGG